MLKIDCFEHPVFTSNTYLLNQNSTSKDVFLVDIGSSKDVIDSLKKGQNIKAIFLTHAHYDHIYGINDIIKHFPDCIVYCSEYCSQGLFSDKMNLSFYHDNPIVFEGGKVIVISEGMSIQLYSKCHLSVIETEGHNKGSLSFIIGNNIFTGDSLIPGYKVVTKLKSGNKEDALKSILKILKITRSTDTLYPGHGLFCKVSEINWKFYIENDRN